MSERWRNELRKLRGVEPPDDLRARVDRAPIDEPLPANRQRVIAGVVAFALFAASGAFAWRALSPQGGPADVGGPSPSAPAEGDVVIVANGQATSDPNDPIEFSIQMRVGNVDVTGASGGFQTDITYADGTGSSAIGDAAYPSFKPSDYVEVPAGATLVLQTNASALDGSASAGADPFEGSQPVDLTTGVVPDLPLGKHVLQINATWTFGPTELFDHAETRAGMSFPIEVVPSSSSPGAASSVHIDCSAAPAISEPVVEAGPKGVLVRSPDGGNLEFHNEASGNDLGWGTDMPLPAPEPETEAVLPLDPGRWSVTCTASGKKVGSFDVTDPGHFFRSPALACPVADQIDLVHRVQTAPDVASNEDLIRLLLPGVQPTDVVELAGYPGRGELYQYRVVRDGRVIAVVEPDQDQVLGAGCTGTGIDEGLNS